MQISLIPSDPPASLPSDSDRYVVALQNRAGERDALRNASKEAWAQMTPLIHFVGPKGKQRLRRATVAAWVRNVAEAVGAHPIYIDVVRLDPVARVETSAGSAPMLDVIYAAARRRGLCFIPVAWVGASSAQHLRCVASAAAADGRGLALRYRVNTTLLPAGITHGQYLGRLAERLRVGPALADVFIDLEYMDPDEEVTAEDLASLITELGEAGPWRSVVLLGTSMPRMMGCVREGTVDRLPRREWAVWRELAQTTGLPRIPAYGDYAVQHPHPPHDGGGPGMRANVRYTTVASTLVARGRGPVVQEGSEQYRHLCQQIAESDEFCGRHYSWGDRVIDDVALGRCPPGAQRMWRGAGTSHHLEFVTDRLRRERPAGTAASGFGRSSDPAQAGRGERLR